MAIYEFVCGSCGKEFEVKRPISQSSEPATCPECGGEGRKLISGFASTEGYGVKGTTKPPFRGTPSE